MCCEDPDCRRDGVRAPLVRGECGVVCACHVPLACEAQRARQSEAESTRRASGMLQRGMEQWRMARESEVTDDDVCIQEREVRRAAASELRILLLRPGPGRAA